MRGDNSLLVYNILHGARDINRTPHPHLGEIASGSCFRVSRRKTPWRTFTPLGAALVEGQCRSIQVTAVGASHGKPNATQFGGASRC